jgi:hypothetical protein
MIWKKTIDQKRQIQNADGYNNVPDGGWGWVVTDKLDLMNTCLRSQT